MKELIDLYAKLVIGTFAFIGPSFTLLIPLFYPPFKRSKEAHEQREKILQSIISEDIKNAKGDALKQIQNGQKALSKLLRKSKIETNLLKPKRQVRRLFISIGLALTLIAFYYFQHSHFWHLDSQLLRLTCLSISLISFVNCLWVLWQVFCTIIKLKAEEEEEKLRKTNKLPRFTQA